MFGVIDNYDFGEMEVMKYHALPSSWSKEKIHDTTYNRIISQNWIAAEKKDGFFGKFVKDDNGEMLLYSRSRGVNGQFANKIEWVPQLAPFFEALPNGTCLLGELYLPTQPGSKCVQTILGCLKDKAIARQDKGEKIHFYVFDCLAYEGINYLNKGYEQRAKEVEQIGQKFSEATPFAQFAAYHSGNTLWMKLQEILADGGEGIVLMHKDGVYEPGKRPAKTTQKVKKELKQTIDCFFTGVGTPPTKMYEGKEIKTWSYWLNEITGEKINGEKFKEYSAGAPIIPITKGYYYGWCGSLEIAVLKEKAGSTVTCGGTTYDGYELCHIGWLSGVTDEMKANPEQFAWRPIEVSAMELDSVSMALRHGKMIGWRDDLTLLDCTFEKIKG